MKLKSGMRSLTLRSRMLLLFGGGTGIILLFVKIVSLFGVPFWDIKGEYELQTNNAISDLQVIGDQQKKILAIWFHERLADLSYLSSDGKLQQLVEAGSVDNTATKDANSIANDKKKQKTQQDLTNQLDLFLSISGQYAAIDYVDAHSGVSLVSTYHDRVGQQYPYGQLFLGTGLFIDRKIIFVKQEDESFAILFVSPVHSKNGHELRGFLVIETPEELFRQQVLNVEKSIGSSGEIILIDMQKTLLTPLKYDLPDRTTALPLEYTLQTKAAEYAAWGVDGLVEDKDYRGVEVVSVVRHLRLTPGFAVSMIVSLEQSELYAPVHRSLEVSLVVLGLGLSMIVLLVVIVARQLASPLEQLNMTTVEIGKGNLGARAPVAGSYEMQTLSDMFNTMAERIQHSHEFLEAEVEKRTVELEKNNKQLKLEIAERQEAEEKIRLSEERFRLAMDATNDGLWDWDIGTGRMYCSPQYFRMLGYEPDELAQHVDTWLDLLHPDDKQIAVSSNEACINNDEQAFSLEFRLRAKNGSYRDILGRGRVVRRDEHGKAVKMIGTHVDITERKHLEQQLLQSQKMESVGRLAGGIAHDFNNMLAVIFLALELARTKLEDGHPLHSQLNDIAKAAKRSRDITRHLLAFSRKQVIAPQKCQLNDLYKALEGSLVRLIGEDIDLQFIPDEDLGYVLVDPTQMDQVFVNLAVNARDAMPQGGRLTVQTGNVTLGARDCEDHPDVAPGEFVNISVRDEGVGIPEERLKNIFEPFFTTKEVGQGTGLGLAMIYGVVKQNGGIIEVESTVGSGTTFKLFFPRVEHNESVELKDVEDVKGTTEVLQGDGNILLVEDDGVLCKMTSSMLEALGYHVMSFQSPDAALSFLKEHSSDFSLLLTDVVMPGMNGRELAESVKAIRPDVKVVFMSGYTADIVVRQGVVEENVNFIQKPFSIKKLAGTVKEVIESA